MLDTSQWLTEPEILTEFGFLPSTFEFWRLKGSSALDGRKPRCRRDSRGGRPFRYARSDIERIAEAATAGTRVFRDEQGVLWITEIEARDRYARQLPLARYRKQPHWKLQRKIDAQRRIVTTSGPRRGRLDHVWFYKQDDVQLVASVEDRPPPPRRADEDQWLTTREACKQFKFTKHGLLHWRASRCLYLGRRLKAQRMLTMIDGQRRQLWRYWLPDLTTIAEKAAGHHGIIRDAEGEWWTEPFIRRTYGTSYSSAPHWRRRRWPGLPGETLRAKRIPTPDGIKTVHRSVWVYLADHVRFVLATPDGRTKRARQVPPVAIPPTPRAKKPAEPGTGRPRSETTAELQRFCYEGYIRGDKLASIRLRAAESFATPPRSDAAVSVYVRRYAAANGLTLDRNGG